MRVAVSAYQPDSPGVLFPRRGQRGEDGDVRAPRRTGTGTGTEPMSGDCFPSTSDGLRDPRARGCCGRDPELSAGLSPSDRETGGSRSDQQRRRVSAAWLVTQAERKPPRAPGARPAVGCSSAPGAVTSAGRIASLHHARSGSAGFAAATTTNRKRPRSLSSSPSRSDLGKSGSAVAADVVRGTRSGDIPESSCYRTATGGSLPLAASATPAL
jgi:hypothetical protein